MLFDWLHSDCIAEVKKLKREIDNYKRELDALMTRCDSYDAQVEAMETEVGYLDSANKDLVHELKALKAKTVARRGRPKRDESRNDD